MAQENRTTLKGYFETGDTPTQSQFINLLDSLLNLVDSGITEAEAAYLSGVTSAIQTQLDAKADLTGATFTGTIIIESTLPFLQLVDSNAAVDNQKISIRGEEGDLRVQFLNDAGSGGGDYATFERNGNQLTQLSFMDSGTKKVIIDILGNGYFKSSLETEGTATIGAYTLPATDGTAGQVLKTDGSGNLTWQDV